MPRKDGNNRKGQGAGNKNAEKQDRRVELGWANFDRRAKETERQYHQVRTPRGGGIKHLLCPKQMTVMEILQMGTALFFDNTAGKFQKSDFSFEILNSRLMPIDDTSKTVQEMYATEHVKLLRLYIGSKAIELDQLESVDTEEDSKDPKNVNVAKTSAD